MRIVNSLYKFMLRLTAAAVVAGALLYYLLGTQSGLQQIWKVAVTFLPEKVSVGSVQGNLISHFVIRDVVYHDDGVNVAIQTLGVRWDVLKLWKKQLVIHAAEIDGVSIEITQKQHAAQPSTVKTEDILNWLKRISIEQISIHHAYFKLNDARIELSGNLDKEWHAEWSANVPNLNQFAADIRGKLITKGTINGSRLEPQINAVIDLDQFATEYFSIRSLSGYIHSQYQGKLTNLGKLHVKGLTIEDLRVPDLVLNLKGQLHDDNYHLAAEAVLSPVNVVTAQFTLPNISTLSVSPSFTASAKVNVKDFSQFNTLFVDVPQVRDFRGQVTGAFTGSGELLHPVFDGALVADHASVYIPAGKLSLTDIHLNARYHTGQKVGLNGTFTAGEGHGSVDGTYDIEDTTLPLMLNLRGTDMSVIDTKEYKVKISPEMTVDYHGNDLVLGGKILVPYAEIHPVDFRSTATLPSDVVIVNDHSTAITVVPTNVALRVQVVLGQRVKLQYRELKTKLQGSITITGTEGNPMTAAGELSIEDGTYRAYGRNLDIQQGRLIYAGNLLNNPGINLRASQTIKTVGFSGSSQFDSSELKPVYSGAGSILVGVSVSGVIDKPNITLFSDESGLSQGDILSYLLFGYPQSQLSSSSSVALLGVASEMYGGDLAKKNPVESLQNKLGLDELGVGSVEYFNVNNTDQAKNNTTQKATTVNVGRSFGHNLSVHYSVGLFEQIQIFSLRYQIDRHFAVQTETSTLENGGDLLYQLESAH